MIKIHRKWSVKEGQFETELAELQEETDFSELFLKICCQRGLDTKEKIESFIEPANQSQHDPYLIHDMEKAVNRINQAISAGETITVYGDYDADGITSTALLTEALTILGAQVDFYIPNRFTDGYGPSLARYQALIEAGTELFITVDNGIAGHEALEYAKEQNIDVIVTDHHAIPENLPEAYALVHPALKSAHYPFDGLAGVGVAYKLVAALDNELADEYLEWVAIGTVADLVPLVDENRSLVVKGLKQLRHTDCPGLLALMQKAGVEAPSLDETTIGFQIAPRLNALGRMGDANAAVHLLLTDDEMQATQIAEMIEETNISRKKLVADIFEQAKLIGNTYDFQSNYIVVLAHEDWHPGVLGIVASRLVEEWQRPVILLALDIEKQQAKGSGRSVAGFNLFRAGQKARDYTLQFGGHEMAAGLTVATEQIEKFTEAINQDIDWDQLPEPTLQADLEISPEDVSLEMIEEINWLKPFGTLNESPKFIVSQADARQVKAVGAHHAHLKFLASGDNANLDVIAFNHGKLEQAMPEKSSVKIFGQLEINEWNGYRKPQINADAISIPRPYLLDERSNELRPEMFKDTSKIYWTYQPSLGEFIKKHFSEVTIMSSDEDFQNLDQTIIQEVVIVDFPPSEEAFLKTLELFKNHWVTLYLFKDYHWVIDGLPTREECARLYKILSSQKEIPWKQLNERVRQLNLISSQKWPWILKMFIEAKFVTMHNGVIKLNQSPDKVDLKTMPSYLYLVEQKKLEEKLLYSSFHEIKEELGLLLT